MIRVIQHQHLGKRHLLVICILMLISLLSIDVQAQRPVSKPTLVETQRWLMDELRGIAVKNGSDENEMRTKYQRFEFKNCTLDVFFEKYFFEDKSTLFDAYIVDLKTLEEVVNGISVGGAWVVSLKTYRNFSNRYGSERDLSNADEEMTKEIVLTMPDEETAARVTRAFTRVKELCGVPKADGPF